MTTSLEKYYPQGTAYFHAYPFGEDSNFFNTAEGWSDALLSSLALLCGGEKVKIITYAATSTQKVLALLRDQLGVKIVDQKNIIFLPKEISAEVEGHERNVAIKAALKRLVPKGMLVMSQPYLDKELSEYFQIKPVLTNWLNDKQNMDKFIPEKFLLKHILTFPNGKAFTSYEGIMPIPSVVKVASSSAGEGVRVCYNADDLDIAKKKFAKVSGQIFIQEYRKVTNNYCVQFGIPSDKLQNIEIIGTSDQFTNSEGKFMGGIVDLQRKSDVIDKIQKMMVEVVLPKVRELGWHGVGGIDVIVDENENFYLIDCNFRMTGTMAYLFQVNRKDIQKSMVYFTASFLANEKDFQQKIIPLAKQGDKNQLLNIITFTEEKGRYWFNMGMLYDNKENRKENAKQLLQLGVIAPVLEEMIL